MWTSTLSALSRDFFEKYKEVTDERFIHASDEATRIGQCAITSSKNNAVRELTYRRASAATDDGARGERVAFPIPSSSSRSGSQCGSPSLPNFVSVFLCYCSRPRTAASDRGLGLDGSKPLRAE